MRQLIIDGDIIAYRTCAAMEREVRWDENVHTLDTDITAVKGSLDNQIETLMEKLDADDAIICVSDDANFRKDIYPDYKTARKDKRKPCGYKASIEHLVRKYKVRIKPRLEADDTMGIFATLPFQKYERVLVSMDKDMKTIPCLLFNPYGGKDAEVVEIDEFEADYWHMYQTLVGDSTDGYPGCPGIGAKRATTLIDVPTNTQSLWEITLATFEKAGLTADDALLQARLARILRADDYDFKKKEPILWEPSPRVLKKP